MTLNTIEGVTKAINALLGTKQDKQSPAMIAAYEGVLSLIESKAGGNQQIIETVAKVRKAINLPKPKEKINAPKT